MAEFLPVIIVGSIIGAFAICFVIAYLAISKEKQNEDDDRHMSDKELVVRLLRYAKPYWKSFVLVLFIRHVSIIIFILFFFPNRKISDNKCNCEGTNNGTYDKYW